MTQSCSQPMLGPLLQIEVVDDVFVGDDQAAGFANLMVCELIRAESVFTGKTLGYNNSLRLKVKFQLIRIMSHPSFPFRDWYNW